MRRSYYPAFRRRWRNVVNVLPQYRRCEDIFNTKFKHVVSWTYHPTLRQCWSDVVTSTLWYQHCSSVVHCLYDIATLPQRACLLCMYVGNILAYLTLSWQRPPPLSNASLIFFKFFDFSVHLKKNEELRLTNTRFVILYRILWFQGGMSAKLD